MQLFAGIWAGVRDIWAGVRRIWAGVRGIWAVFAGFSPCSRDIPCWFAGGGPGIVCSRRFPHPTTEFCVVRRRFCRNLLGSPGKIKFTPRWVVGSPNFFAGRVTFHGWFAEDFRKKSAGSPKIGVVRPRSWSKYLQNANWADACRKAWL